MHSIRTRLNLLLIVIVTLLLASSGAYSYSVGRRLLSQELFSQEQALRQRLSSVLPSIVWQLDEVQLDRMLRAEMQWQDLTYLGLATEAVPRLAWRREEGRIVQRMVPPPAGAQPLPIFFEGRRVGTLYYQVSAERMQVRLNNLVTRKVVEIVLLDLILVLVLMRAFSTVILRPLAALRAALDRAAEQGQLAPGQLQHIRARRDELAGIARSVETIIQRLSDELEDRKRSESMLRGAKQQVDSAYRELQVAQASLVQSEKMASLGALVAGVAHEVNTPVGVILTGASVLKEESEAFGQRVQAGAVKKSELLAYSGTAVESARLILANAERAAQLIQSFKRVAVDQTSEARRGFELQQYLQEILTSLTPTLRRSPVRIVLDCPERIEMDGYPGALSQILTNLLTNALSHAFADDAPGTVRIVALPDGGNVALAVEDDGQGIAPEHLPRIFDPFFTTKRGRGGSGLGLHLVYNLVTQTLGGQIAVHSEPGQGTRFSITLPRIAPQRQNV
ncbi:ATP-binding protein [Chitiniphilus purpureus]|uniref:histidine kinase n=1 Tax=Chitiniphilus purpureus TaxID=2981137 RepID=A0ABY6DHU3_9NEIS|nr:ATP-binding protein [Chitiniphilus sp. CD1]UXY13924.1 ATP-binding protein [Chitiniphilus sp. CD1]